MFDIMTIGNATTDVLLESKAFKVYRDKRFEGGYAEAFALGSKVPVDSVHMGVGGGAINAAITFARQGLKAAYIGRVGADIGGSLVRSKLEEEHIFHQRTLVDVSAQTPYSTILITESGERTVLVFRGNMNKLHVKDLHLDDMETLWLYITSIGGNIKTLRAILEYAADNRIKVAMNPGISELEHKDFVKLIPLVDVLLMNAEEAEYIVPKQHRHGIGIFEAFKGLTKAITVVTNGARGAAVCDGRMVYYVHAAKTKVVDRSGAGDAFGSGFVTGLIKTSGNIPFAMRMAVSNAASVCGKYGANNGILHANDKLLNPTVTTYPI